MTDPGYKCRMSGGTIYALSTAPGRAGIAVVRVSGVDAAKTLRQVTGAVPPARMARFVRLSDAQGETIDRGLALFFPAPASVTGEDVAEFHVHGSRAVVAALAETLARLGLAPAEPGEFTRRAFLNSKLDLAAAEGLADLVAAETAAQRRQALRQLEGELGRRTEAWRARLIDAEARLEAAIDFPDEDLPPDLWRRARSEAAQLAQEIAAQLADGHRGERLRDGIAVAILGPPNAGKSSLMNALAQRDVAITAASAGTTRDVIEVALDLGGYPVLLADTAGLREVPDAVEAEGVRRAQAQAASADLKL
ncbi:MAG: tRNA uridine-5-carboxymethylaminomethyl(34) synthesis GTPase MnmE, partial [Stellaceae bacterium]